MRREAGKLLQKNLLKSKPLSHDRGSGLLLSVASLLYTGIRKPRGKNEIKFPLWGRWRTPFGAQDFSPAIYHYGVNLRWD